MKKTTAKDVYGNRPELAEKRIIACMEQIGDAFDGYDPYVITNAMSNIMAQIIVQFGCKSDEEMCSQADYELRETVKLLRNSHQEIA